jgi:hypothetical protein
MRPFNAAISACLVERGAGLGHDDRRDGFAEVAMRHADHGGFEHPRQFVEIGLDLLGIHVVAAGDDQVLAASDDRQIAIGIPFADVAGAEPSVVGEFLARLLGHAPVPGEHVRAAHLDCTDLAGRAWQAVFGDDPHVDTRQRQPDGACDPVAVVGIGREHHGLAHAVALENARGRCAARTAGTCRATAAPTPR